MRPSLTVAFAAFALATPTLSVFAQTAKPATTHSATTHYTSHTSERGGCLTDLPKMSDKIPAVPAGSACPKALYTITRHSDLTLDYKAPVVSGSYLEDTFGTRPTTITLGYIDTKIGVGSLARPDMYYTVKYTGYLPDGTKFDSSDDHPGAEPITFPYGKHQVIAGWDTGFEGMRVGGKRRIFVPYQLAYGDSGKPPTIPAKSELVFDMEFVSQSATPPPAKTPATPPGHPGMLPGNGGNGAKMAPRPTPAEPAKPETK